MQNVVYRKWRTALLDLAAGRTNSEGCWKKKLAKSDVWGERDAFIPVHETYVDPQTQGNKTAAYSVV